MSLLTTTGGDSYCTRCNRWGCYGCGVQWMNPIWTSTCEHCYCQKPGYKEDHLQCCKCLTQMHRKFVGERSITK